MVNIHNSVVVELIHIGALAKQLGREIVNSELTKMQEGTSSESPQAPCQGTAARGRLHIYMDLSCTDNMDGIIRILFGKVYRTKEKLLKDNAGTRVSRKPWSRTFS